MKTILNEYYTNNAKKLRRMVDKILKELGISEHVDHDDFYCLANEVVTKAINNYNPELPFDDFIYCCLVKKIKTEMTRRNRIKRRCDKNSISIYTKLGDEDNSTIEDLIADSFNLEEFVIGDKTDKFELYLNELSKLQRQIVGLLVESYGASEIREILHIDKRQYSDAMMGIHAYENISLLF